MGHVSKTIKATFAASILILATGSVQASAAAFDGEWKVQIDSSRASCGGHRVSIDIADGKVASTSMMVTASGRVAEAGNISVTLKAGPKHASGSGRLSGTSGTGTWSGDQCSGTWTAQRI
jgi:hypothetical protein